MGLGVTPVDKYQARKDERKYDKYEFKLKYFNNEASTWSYYWYLQNLGHENVGQIDYFRWIFFDIQNKTDTLYYVVYNDKRHICVPYYRYVSKSLIFWEFLTIFSFNYDTTVCCTFTTLRLLANMERWSLIIISSIKLCLVHRHLGHGPPPPHPHPLSHLF